MRDVVEQGDVLKVDNVKVPVLTVSKNFFNQTGEIVGCPVYTNGAPGTLHKKIETDRVSGIVHCEKLALFDLSIRRYAKIGRISMSDIVEITDTVQSIFDYV